MTRPETGGHPQIDITFHKRRAASYDADVAGEYAVYDSFELLPFLDRAWERAPGGVVADLGCGTGEVTLHLARRGFRVHAFDHSPAMIEQARIKASREGLEERIVFHVRELDEALPFDNATIDGATCQRVLHHLRDAVPVVSEVERVLKPQGFFYVSDYTGDMRAGVRALRFGFHLLARKSLDPPVDDAFLAGHETRRSGRQLVSLLVRNSFDCTFRYYDHIGLRGRLSEPARARLIRALSWRSHNGDMVFIYGTKR